MTDRNITEEPCNWKFQCPHLQECVNGRCKCPRGQQHNNGYGIDMVWNRETNTCESTAGSYCNNANFQEPQKDLVIKSILKSMMEIRCVAGLRCEGSNGIEIGVCVTGASNVLTATAVVNLTFLIYFLSCL